jgi:hypothetical protein
MSLFLSLRSMWTTLIRQNLLRKEGSLFKSLAEKSGKFKDLYRAAQKKENGDQKVPPPEYDA